MTVHPRQDHPARGVVFNIDRYMVYDGPGIRTVVFLKGCPLRCLWCANPESHRFGPELMVFEDKCIGCGRCLEVCPSDALTTTPGGKVSVDLSRCSACGKCAEVCPSEALVMSGRVMTSEDVVSEILKDIAFYRRSCGGVTLSGGEPTAQPAFAEEILRKCREQGVHTAIETCGYARWEQMERVVQPTQLVYLDLKHANPIEHANLTGRSNALILANATRLFALADAGRLDVVVRYTCVPGYNDAPGSIAEIAELLARSKVRRLELLRYHELGVPKYGMLEREYELKDVRTDDRHLGELCALVASYGVECRVL